MRSDIEMQLSCRDQERGREGPRRAQRPCHLRKVLEGHRGSTTTKVAVRAVSCLPEERSASSVLASLKAASGRRPLGTQVTGFPPHSSWSHCVL